jgi:hypothetical protein
MAQVRCRIVSGRTGIVVTVVGAAIGIVPILWHGWAQVSVIFATEDPSGARVLRRVGIDVDKPIAAVAEREVNRAIPPTLWQVRGHVFQIIAVLLVFAVLTGVVAFFMYRWRRIATGGTLLTSCAAVGVNVVALLHIRTTFNRLPDTIDAAIRTSGALGQVVGYTTGRPQVAPTISWPVIASSVGISITLVGAVIAFVASLRPARSPATVPDYAGVYARTQEAVHDNVGDSAAVPDDRSAADAHSDPRAL